MPHGHIFISYDRVDSQFPALIKEWLAKLYEDVWFDTDENSGTQAWWDAILAYLHSCDAVVFTVSPNSIQSKYCQAELTEARRLHKPIVPVIVRPTELPSDLAKLRVVDMSSELVTQNLSRLYKEVNYAVEEYRYRTTRQPPLSSQPTPLPK